MARLGGDEFVLAVTLVDRADVAIYQAKQSGRNKIQFYALLVKEKSPIREMSYPVVAEKPLLPL
ncbi:putative signal transduction protein with EAL and GGDEF domain [Glaciimonas immobilis]|uniref:Putative signal transduction protein with EAL and GGDEF domain n=1 Tax=Glaciimonas immobilis TaxID=728004 RepID=A0A840RSG0_9BURK|nr:hypothetical protein [Glaciimonas immobilis]MBB5199510.1 putative signal transduction protein with EAL and GGDEF domain [Glaciimonas immobilis]